ncbi:MAG TPA: SCO family protein [Candidatus Binatus sp.]|nr:SCO family protein [Candidatus Binatus sp.]
MNQHSRRISPIALVCIALLAGASLFSCRRANPPAAKRYPFSGRVISVDTQAQSALIDGDAIPGFMDAMAMSYKVKPSAALKQLTPGDSVSADVVVQRDRDPEVPPDYWLENVRVIAHADPAPAAAGSALHMPAPGEEVPDFSFTNQNGKHVSLKQYRGNALLVTFIYTRCPFPDFCPRVSSNFAEIYKQLDTNPALAGTRLLSISFDPEHDTPKVLRDYGFSVAHTQAPALFKRWEFAAPSVANLPQIAGFFALSIKPEGGLITHNLSTAVIGPDGKIVKWYHGSDWQVSDLMKDVAAIAPKN